MATVTLAREAMATRFEILLHGDNPAALRAAGEEALEEIDRLEAQLSLYRPSSEIAHLNARAAKEPVRVSPTLFALLEHARKLHHETGGAFDITIAPLVRCWGFMGGTGRMPQDGELAEARANVGMDLVQLRPEDFTVRFAREGVMLDLGAIGKGYAIECAAEVLSEAGVTSALIHGGTSTIYALGHPPDSPFWKVAVENPERRLPSQPSSATSELPPGEQSDGAGSPPGIGGEAASPLPYAAVGLKNEALSVSAVWGRAFQAEGKLFGHVLDPRTGQPAANAVLAAVVLPSATESDALSTALLTRGTEGHQVIASLRPGMRTLLVIESDGHFCVETNGAEADPVKRFSTSEQRQS